MSPLHKVDIRSLLGTITLARKWPYEPLVTQTNVATQGG